MPDNPSASSDTRESPKSPLVPDGSQNTLSVPNFTAPFSFNTTTTRSSPRPYSETILQTPILAIDSTSLPESYIASPGSSSSRRRSSGSMRNASMTFESIQPSQTPTGRISKAKKGKRVHACEFEGCGKVFTRNEHRRRHQLNHSPDAIYRCQQPGCDRTFQRLDLLQRHQERHDGDHMSPASIPYTSSPSMVSTSVSAYMTQPTTSSMTGRSPSNSMPVNVPTLPSSHNQYSLFDTSTGTTSIAGPYMPYAPLDDTGYYTGSDASSSPVLHSFLPRAHHPTITSSPYDSPMITLSVPESWLPATTSPSALPENTFSDGSVAFIPISSGGPMPVSLSELDGNEWTRIQQELSAVRELVFATSELGIPSAIRWHCLELYWQHFHSTLPIIHRPSFFPTRPPPLLASAMIAIGSFYDSLQDARLYSSTLLDIATRLLQERQQMITSRSRIADLQTVILLEYLRRFQCLRIAITPTLRFRQLIQSFSESSQWLPTSPLTKYRALKVKRAKAVAGAHKFWVDHESRRRAYHACLVIDTQNKTVFGQRSIVDGKVPHVHVGMPCDADLWAVSPTDEWQQEADKIIGSRSHKSGSKHRWPPFFDQQILHTQQSQLQQMVPPLSPTAPSREKFTWSLMRMIQHVPLAALLIVSGCHAFMPVESLLPQQVRAMLVDWHASNAMIAHWHALRLLNLIIDTDQPGLQFRETDLLYEEWAIFLALLVCLVRSDELTAPTAARTPKGGTRSSLGKRKAVEVETPEPKRRQTLPSSEERKGIRRSGRRSTDNNDQEMMARSYLDDLAGQSPQDLGDTSRISSHALKCLVRVLLDRKLRGSSAHSVLLQNAVAVLQRALQAPLMTL